MLKSYKFLILILPMLILLSCSEKERIRKLENENKSLKQQIDRLNNEIDNYRFKPILIENERTIKLGDSFEGIFFIGTYNNLNPSTVLIYDSTFKTIIDTVRYEPKHRGHYYIEKPTRKGKHEINAKMIINSIKDTVDFLINYEYEVK